MQVINHWAFNASFVNEQTRQMNDEYTQRPVKQISIEKSADDVVHADVISAHTRYGCIYSLDRYGQSEYMKAKTNNLPVGVVVVVVVVVVPAVAVVVVGAVDDVAVPETINNAQRGGGCGVRGKNR